MRERVFCFLLREPQRLLQPEGDPQKALDYANKALELDPKSDRAWFQKGKADEGQGHLDQAVDSVNPAIAFNPRASSYYYVLAGLYRRLGKMDDSRKALGVIHSS